MAERERSHDATERVIPSWTSDCRPACGFPNPKTPREFEGESEPGFLNTYTSDLIGQTGHEKAHDWSGDDRDRTGNLVVANHALSQLSYVPEAPQ